MKLISRKFKALISSDWNECLAPCGPFDVITFNYPELTQSLHSIFQQYTGNQISLGKAAGRINKLIPKSLTIEQVDNYLDQKFITYRNVKELIQWCLDNGILFMINTTGLIGYFQRIFAKKLLPVIPVLSAHPFLRFSTQLDDPEKILCLTEITHKGRNTKKVMEHYNILPQKTILMGDSGGDGPHFLWGKTIGAHLIGSMTKFSLKHYCAQNDIHPDLTWGISYEKEEKKTLDAEMNIDFLDLIPFIKKSLK